MKALLIDDEYSNNENLTALLHKYCPHINVISSAVDIEIAIDLINLHQPDIFSWIFKWAIVRDLTC